MLILIFLQLFLQQVYGQHCPDDIFEIEIKRDTPDEMRISYKDKNSSQYMYPPKFATPVEMDRAVMVELISIQKLDSIESALFTSEELDSFQRGIAIVYIHIPSGRIVSTSFYLKDKVDLNKLKRLKEEIEKNLHFKVRLAAELEKEGYWGKSFRIFVSRNRQ
jgi:hypothetical protein